MAVKHNMNKIDGLRTELRSLQIAYTKSNYNNIRIYEAIRTVKDKLKSAITSEWLKVFRNVR